MMDSQREYRRFSHKGANFRICCGRFEAVTREIVRQRELLEAYIESHAEFATSLEPVPARGEAPDVAKRMARAAATVGVGPMAAVAGTFAQLAAEAGLAAGADEAVVENGGDMFLICRRRAVIGLFAGEGPLSDRLALEISPELTPLAICSSSGRMGHSLSLGDCDLATVTSPDAALADAAATLAANLVRSEADVDDALARIAAIEGIRGVLIVQGGRVGLAGRLPPLAANRDAELTRKVTRDRRSK